MHLDFLIFFFKSSGNFKKYFLLSFSVCIFAYLFCDRCYSGEKYCQILLLLIF